MKLISLAILFCLLAVAMVEASGGLAIPKDVRLRMISQDEAKAFQSPEGILAPPTGTHLVSGVRTSALALLWIGFLGTCLALVGFFLKDLLRDFPQALKRFWKPESR